MTFPLVPVQCRPIFKPKVWGGNAIASVLGKSVPPGEAIGESWELSVRPNDVSPICGGPLDGVCLDRPIAADPAAWLGPAVLERHGPTFPQLVKFLDMNDRLSVQVHPDEAQARRLGFDHGKSECWYVVRASADATLIAGVHADVDRAGFAARTQSGDWDGLFQTVRVGEGDVIHIRPGTVHATLAGSVLVAEFQQDSDTTLRIYDFDRLDHGAKRPLHIEQALSVINFGQEAPVLRAADRRPADRGGARLSALARDPYYALDLIDLDGRFRLDRNGSFRILVGAGGGAELRWPGGAAEIGLGSCWLVPAALEAELAGRARVLLAWS